MRSYCRLTTYPLLFVFVVVATLGTVSPVSADGVNAGGTGATIGTIVGGVLGAVLLNLAIPSVGAIIAGGLLGALIGHVAGRMADGDDGMMSVSDAWRDSWHWGEGAITDVGWWFRDGFDNVRDYFDDKLGKPGAPSAPVNAVGDKDLATLRSEFLETKQVLEETMAGSDTLAVHRARTRYDNAYRAYFGARGAALNQ